LPDTICHFDVFHRNLFARKTADGDDKTVMIDWAGEAQSGQTLTLPFG
jgi:hypothetical protein